MTEQPNSPEEWGKVHDDMAAKRANLADEIETLDAERRDLAFEAQSDNEAAKRVKALRRKITDKRAELEELDAAIERADAGRRDALEAETEAERDKYRAQAAEHARERVAAAQDVDRILGELGEALDRWAGAGDAWTRATKAAGERGYSMAKLNASHAIAGAALTASPSLKSHLVIGRVIDGARQPLAHRERVLLGVEQDTETAA